RAAGAGLGAGLLVMHRSVCHARVSLCGYERRPSIRARTSKHLPGRRSAPGCTFARHASVHLTRTRVSMRLRAPALHQGENFEALAGPALCAWLHVCSSCIGPSDTHACLYAATSAGPPSGRELRSTCRAGALRLAARLLVMHRSI